MYDITILSILRDSTLYIERYLDQLSTVFRHAKNPRAIWVEGNSVDGTYERLLRVKEDKELPGEITLIKHEIGGPFWPSVDVPERWAQLEHCWNRAIAALEPSEICVAVESDLFWSNWHFQRVKKHLDKYDVIAPMLMHQFIEFFYDTNGFRKNGANFECTPFPYCVPGGWNGDRFIDLDTCGGMIVTSYDAMRAAVWKNKCVMHFQPHYRIAVDTETRIYHPVMFDPIPRDNSFRLLEADEREKWL